MARGRADTFALFAEERGEYLTQQELVFCHAIIQGLGSTGAAQAAKCPQPYELSGDRLYRDLRELIEEYLEEVREDYFLSVKVLRDQMRDGAPSDQIKAAKEMIALRNFAAPKEINVNLNAQGKVAAALAAVAVADEEVGE